MKFTDRKLIILFGLAFSLPLFFVGLKGHDVVNHLIISRLFAEQFFSGDVYPRWLFKAENGFGSPVLYFFPRLPYYVTLLFYPLKYFDAYLKLPSGYLALYFSGALSLILSGCAANLCLNNYADKSKALLGAIFYMGCSYHLLDIYSRYAFSEIWAFVFLPLCVHYVKINRFNPLAFSFAGLALTHMLTLIISVPVLIIFILIQKQPRLILALVSGLALTIFYWLPGMLYEPLISSPDGRGYYSIAQRFLSYRDVVILSAALPFIFISLLALLPIVRQHNNESRYWLFITVLCIFMSCSASAFVWDLLPGIVHKISFPWRFLTIATFSACILLIRLPLKVLPVIIIFNLTFAYPALREVNSENPSKYLDYDLLTLDNFRSVWTPQTLVAKDGFKDFSQLNVLKFSGVKTSLKTDEILVDSSRAGWITIPQFYFPTFQAQYKLRPEPQTGLMQINIPLPGSFSIRLERGGEEKTALLLSSLIFILMLLKNWLPLICRKTA